MSLPDFDPNNPADALEPDRINRITVGVFEMGSTFKALTTAMALDSGKFTINSIFDARSGLRFGRFTIHDYHATGRVLTVPEVFVHSSNIGTARMALAGRRGPQGLPEEDGPARPAAHRTARKRRADRSPRWGELNTVTIAFGHGLAVAPLQAVWRSERS